MTDSSVTLRVLLLSVTPPFRYLHLLRPLSLLQVDEKKGSQTGGSQAAPPGMSEVSEEEDLQAAEEVSVQCFTFCNAKLERFYFIFHHFVII